MVRSRYYTVWTGHKPGVYSSWDECRAQVVGFKGARFKSFATREEAEQELMLGSPDERSGEVQALAASRGRMTATHKSDSATGPKASAAPSAVAVSKPFARRRAATKDAVKAKSSIWMLPPGVEKQAIAVDAACSGNPGQMEYRGVYLRDGRQLFHFGPVWGTNNIGEFLAIVHALAVLKQKGIKHFTVYSDSRNAILWVRARICRTKLRREKRTEEVFSMISRAEAWLRDNDYDTTIIKWETARWGEIPADFGRKH